MSIDTKQFIARVILLTDGMIKILLGLAEALDTNPRFHPMERDKKGNAVWVR